MSAEQSTIKVESSLQCMSIQEEVPEKCNAMQMECLTSSANVDAVLGIKVVLDAIGFNRLNFYVFLNQRNTKQLKRKVNELHHMFHEVISAIKTLPVPNDIVELFADHPDFLPRHFTTFENLFLKFSDRHGLIASKIGETVQDMTRGDAIDAIVEMSSFLDKMIRTSRVVNGIEGPLVSPLQGVFINQEYFAIPALV